MMICEKCGYDDKGTNAAHHCSVHYCVPPDKPHVELVKSREQYLELQLAELQRQLEEKTRLLAAYELALNSIGQFNVRSTPKGAQCTHEKYGWEDCENCYSDFANDSLESTAHLDVLLAEAERRGMERAAEICEDISKNGRGGAGTCVRAIRAAAQNQESTAPDGEAGVL